MQTLTLPKGGKTMEEGMVIEWLVEEGDPVAEGDPVVLFESEKMTSEVAADEDGVLLERLVEEGETVPVGTTLGHVGREGEDPIEADQSSDVEQPSADDRDAAGDIERDEPPQYRSMPSARRAAREQGVSLDDVAVATGAEQLTADHVKAFTASEGDLDTGGAIGARDATSSATNTTNSTRDAVDVPTLDADELTVEPVANPEGSVLGSPWARVLASNYGVSLEAVGEAIETDRIRATDVETYVERAGSDVDGEPELAGSDAAETDRSIARQDPITGTDGVMFDRMSRVTNEYASTTTVVRVDVTELMELYERLSSIWIDEQDVPLSLTAFVVRAVGQSLPEYDVLNAEVTEDRELRVYDEYNVGIAVDTDRGLLVPTIYDADDRSIRDLSAEIARLAEGAHDRSLDHDDLRNGTFTVSNAGSLGAYINTPQINPPQTAVLGMCTVFDEAGVVNGEVVPRKMMHLTLTYDHRVVEGATAVGFIQRVKSLLESPETLLS